VRKNGPIHKKATIAWPMRIAALAFSLFAGGPGKSFVYFQF
jgi:hypothetical protein